MIPKINIADEYAAANQGGSSQPAPDDAGTEQDIPVTAQQMVILKQLAADQKFEELGRLVAGLITAAPAAEPPMMQ